MIYQKLSKSYSKFLDFLSNLQSFFRNLWQLIVNNLKFDCTIF